MPSPIGHALSGVAVAWTASLSESPRDASPGVSDRLLPVCAALAAAPDLDLLVRGSHRTATHSLTAMLLVTIVAAAVTGQVTRLRASRVGGQAPRRGSQLGGEARWRVALLCGISYGSHLLLDWLGTDNYPPRGIELLWPFSNRWFISDIDLFRQTARQEFLTVPIIGQNLLAVAQECLILVPILALLWWARRRQRQRASQYV